MIVALYLDLEDPKQSKSDWKKEDESPGRTRENGSSGNKCPRRCSGINTGIVWKIRWFIPYLRMLIL